MIGLDKRAALPFITKISSNLTEDNLFSYIELLCLARKEGLLLFSADCASIEEIGLSFTFEGLLREVATNNEEDVRVATIKLLVSQVRFIEVITKLEYETARRFCLLSLKNSDQKYR